MTKLSPTSTNPPVSISPRAYRTMRAVEDTHWWFDGMETITRRLLAKARVPDDGRAGRALDAGCGTGRNLVFLERYGAAVGMDGSRVALECCRERGLERLVLGTVNALPFADGAFDLVTSFDVLTAGGVDDRTAWRESARELRPGGHLLVRVAAYDSLRSRHDQEWTIQHRYRRGELCAKVVAAGLEVRQSSYANMWLLPVALAKRWAERWFPPRNDTSDLELGARRSVGTRMLRAVLASEARWVAAGALPGGLSLIVLARKPGGS